MQTARKSQVYLTAILKDASILGPRISWLVLKKVVRAFMSTAVRNKVPFM